MIYSVFAINFICSCQHSVFQCRHVTTPSLTASIRSAYKFLSTNSTYPCHRISIVSHRCCFVFCRLSKVFTPPLTLLSCYCVSTITSTSPPILLSPPLFTLHRSIILYYFCDSRVIQCEVLPMFVPILCKLSFTVS